MYDSTTKTSTTSDDASAVPFVCVTHAIDYCDIVWQTQENNKIDKVYHRAMKRLGLLSTPNSIIPSPPSSRYRFHISIQTYKIVHGLCPKYLDSTAQQ